MQSAEMFYDGELEPSLAPQAGEGLAGEFEAESDFADAADNDPYLSAESGDMSRNDLEWATESDQTDTTNYRPSQTPAAERIKRLGAVDMADDLTEAVEKYTAHPFGKASMPSDMMSSPEMTTNEQSFEERGFDDRELDAQEFGGDEYEPHGLADHELDDGDYEDERQPEVIAFDDVNEEPVNNHHMFSSPVAAALTRPSEKSPPSKGHRKAPNPASELYAEGNVDEVNDYPDMPRMPDTPKWSESARFHMSNMLAASRDNVTPGDLTSRIDTTPDRHRRSSAMMLLGLPALLMMGFSGAYLYHTDLAKDGNTVAANIQTSIANTALSIVSDDKKLDSSRISESVIEKRDVESIEIVRSEPDLPPPIAPELVELAPLSPQTEAAPTQVADAEEPVATSPVKEAQEQSSPAIQSIPNLPPLDPPKPTELARKPATAPVEQPVVVARGAPKTALPVPVGNAEDLPVEVKPGEVEKEPTITPAGGGFLAEYFNSESTDSASAPEATTAESPQQLAAIAVQPSFGAALTESPEDVTETSLPNAASSASNGEDAQLIVRGNQHLEIGDISAARLLFELAAQNGSSKAATAMGRSYDPLYFQKMGVRGVLPDAETAVAWYEKAINAGDEDANEHLQKLAAWMKQ